MNKFLLHTGLLLVCLVSACGKGGSIQQQSEERTVAVAGNERLLADDFKTAVSGSFYETDSVTKAKKFIEKWAIESLFFQEAQTKLDEQEVQIEKQVQEYRQALVNHIYETKVIEANLDTTISAEEIETYYSEHRDNFILKDNIVKVYYFKIAEKSPALPKIKKVLFSSNPKDKQQLLTLLSENAENFFMNDSTWLLAEDIRKEIPALEQQESFTFSMGRFLELNEEGFYYYLKVKDVMTKNSYSPLNFERNNIRKFILNNRRTQLINQYKQQLLEKAKADKTFVITPQNR